MSDTDSLSEYPSDIEFEEIIHFSNTDYTLDSGIESNDGYLTDDPIELVERNRRVTRNKRLFRKRLRQRINLWLEE